MTYVPTFTVYGLRLKGEIEARYIGQTIEGADVRRRCLLREAKAMPRRTAFAIWLVENRAHIEAFGILTTETRADALRLERQTVKVCLALGHRLFNRHLVPAELRIVARQVAA